MRFILALVACFAVPAFSAEPLKVFDHGGETYACYAADKAASVRYDSVQDLAVAFIELTLFGTSSVQTEPWDACDDARCYGSPDEIKAACPAESSGWTVAGNFWGSDRPLYECDLQCVATKKRGKEIGRTGREGEAECEGELSPPWTSGSSQWQYTSNGGKRGVSLCEPVE